MNDFRFHPDVYNDLEKAYNWYQEKAPGLGVLFLVDLETCYKRISDNPFAWPEFNKKTRISHLETFPYSVVYSCDNGITVVAVKHQRRAPEMIDPRL